MPLIVYLDETGDHSLKFIDKEFPLFTVVLFICDCTEYIQKIVPGIYQLKIDYFSHEGVILHSRDIRKAQGDFGFLTDPKKRQVFYDRINHFMAEADYTLIASVIRKQNLKQQYGLKSENPYDIALTFSLERLVVLLEELGQDHIQIVAESRGKREDNELKLSFLQAVNEGTENITAKRFKRIKFNLKHLPKAMNIIGTQIADLAAYPIARYVLNPEKTNPAYDIIKRKFYKGSGENKGLKIFP